MGRRACTRLYIRKHSHITLVFDGRAHGGVVTTFAVSMDFVLVEVEGRSESRAVGFSSDWPSMLPSTSSSKLPSATTEGNEADINVINLPTTNTPMHRQHIHCTIALLSTCQTQRKRRCPLICVHSITGIADRKGERSGKQVLHSAS